MKDHDRTQEMFKADKTKQKILEECEHDRAQQCNETKQKQKDEKASDSMGSRLESTTDETR